MRFWECVNDDYFNAGDFCTNCGGHRSEIGRPPGRTIGPLCTRYESGQGRHRVKEQCPLAPDVACSPEEDLSCATGPDAAAGEA